VKSVLSQRELDERLRTGRYPDENFAERVVLLIDELDRAEVALEIPDPSNWQRPEPNSICTSHGLQWFLDKVERVLPLDRAEELPLAQRLEFARRRFEFACARAGTPNQSVSGGSELIPLPLARRYAELRGLTTELVERNMHLVLDTARRYARPPQDLQDLLQEGEIGLLQASERFDWRKGVRFRAYATFWILQAIRKHDHES
jgi:DNA-directed RNA polymerase sigma subunit (sigma70/sigma32)